MAQSAQTFWPMQPDVPLGLTRDADHLYTANYPPALPVTYRSVTGILSVLNKPALMNWYGSIAAGWAVDNTATMLTMLEGLGREATVKAVAARGRAERDRKGAIGTAAHGAVEAALNGMAPILTPDTAPLFAQFQRFMVEWEFVPTWSEAMICSERHGYAGTFDLYGELSGKRC